MGNKENRIYIKDFCEDLNYKKIILYIGNVDSEKLAKRLEKDLINKIYRLDYAINDDRIPGRQNFIYIENCDLQNLDYPVHEYIAEEEYNVYVLWEDGEKYFIEAKTDILHDQIRQLEFEVRSLEKDIDLANHIFDKSGVEHITTTIDDIRDCKALYIIERDIEGNVEVYRKGFKDEEDI
jgi:hypothetical protein